MGAVVGATEPEHIARMRELMPRSIFLIPGVGAQGGQPELLGAAFSAGPAAGLVAASRGIAADPDPAAAAERLRKRFGIYRPLDGLAAKATLTATTISRRRPELQPSPMETRTNASARILAALALVGAVLVVVIVIASRHGGRLLSGPARYQPGRQKQQRDQDKPRRPPT